jgi:parvulin-like peptidyl-prolyl isomerase
MVLLGGCGGGEPAVPDQAARIDATAIGYGEFEAYLEENSVDPSFGWGSDVLSALLDQFLDERLLHRLAVDRGLADEAAGSRAAVEQLLESDEDIGELEIAAYYRRHSARFERPERARVHQILLPDEATVDRAQAELAAGAAFLEVAERLSQVPVAAIGDSDAALAREDLPPAFAEAIFALEPGEVSAPVATDYGFHLFQVVERLPAGPEALSAVAAEIGETLRRERAEERLKALVAEARERYNVRVFGRNLPFNYQGLYRDGSPASQP